MNYTFFSYSEIYVYIYTCAFKKEQSFDKVLKEKNGKIYKRIQMFMCKKVFRLKTS